MSLINTRNILGSSKIYRTGNLGKFTIDDYEWLKIKKIDIYIDLRSLKEISNNYIKESDIKYYCFNFNNACDAYLIENASSEAYSKYYLQMLYSCRNEIKQFFEFLSNTNGILIYGCSMGKDRTGVITYLLLRFMEMPYDKVKDDFIKSYNELWNNPDVKKYFEVHGKKDFAERLKILLLSIDEFNKTFCETYSTVDNYFDLIGISASTKKKLYEKRKYYFD